jgi:predicted nucleic acid-binding protein
VPAGYLLDTNVVSEARRERANPSVLAFLVGAQEAEARVFISVLTLGELRKGVAARRARDVMSAANLAKWVDEIEADFSERVLTIDAAIAGLWGELSAGRSLPVVDTLIAATAIVHDLTLVTRNVRDVISTGVAVVNPWHTG